MNLSLLSKYPQSWLDENAPNITNILNACQLIFDRMTTEINLAKQGLNINSAEVWYLDLHGDDLKTPRVPGETDDNYRVRILDEMLRRRNSISAIISAINSIQAGQGAEVYEPWKNLFRIGESKLSGPDKIIDYKFWNYHVVEVLVLVKPELVERTLQKIISAGKTLYITQKFPDLAMPEEERVDYLLVEQNFQELSSAQTTVNYMSSDFVLDYILHYKRLTTMFSTTGINSDEPFNDTAILGPTQMVYRIKNEIQGVDY